MYRIGDILQTALADILKRNLDDLANLIVDGLRDADASRICQLLEANGYVHAGAVQVVIFDDDVAQVYADAELHAFVLGDRRVALSYLVLDLYGTANGLDDAGELGDEAVSGAAEDVTAVRGDRLLGYGTALAQGDRGAFFVALGMAGVPHHIGCENCGEPALHDQAPQ